ncbi:uncharacterized protein METZ01_LOCUS97843 [marine metagenome]|uniref:Uncharacterized protein n=1 Tax=marine metagenome TaxID=408172 RepID=A0A381VXF8_9ZZZZ
MTPKVVNQKIVGYVRGGVPKRSTGADCKSAGLAFVGSNPTPSTICNGEITWWKKANEVKFKL